MKTMRQVGGFWLAAVFFLSFCLTGPILAQAPPEEADRPEPILRLSILDLKVQGEQAPEAVREAFTAILPAAVDCVQAEYQRVSKGPTRITIRFNLSSNGKVVWCKVIDPPLRSLEACLCKVLPKMQLAPSGTTLSRVTVVLEAKQDHLLTP